MFLCIKNISAVLHFLFISIISAFCEQPEFHNTASEMDRLGFPLHGEMAMSNIVAKPNVTEALRPPFPGQQAPENWKTHGYRIFYQDNDDPWLYNLNFL